MMKTRVKATLARATLMASLLSGVVLTLQGCPLLVVGGVGAGTLVATDRRTLGAQTEDREIQVKASAQINENLPDQAHVNVTVFNRRVLLTGEVPNDASKQKAEEVVRGINNVNSIVNELTVQGASSISSRANDSYLEGRVKTAMVGEKSVRPVRFEIPDRDAEAVGLDVQRKIAAHRAQADDPKAAHACHAGISSAAASARSKAMSRVRTPSSSPMTAVNVPSPSGTTRADASWPAISAWRQPLSRRIVTMI